MDTEISIKMKGGINDILYYKDDIGRLEITVEHTGDYSQGMLVFVKEIEKQLKGPDVMQRKSKVLRNLQKWSNETGETLCW